MEIKRVCRLILSVIIAGFVLCVTLVSAQQFGDNPLMDMRVRQGT
jgi:hypothetical protein